MSKTLIDILLTKRIDSSDASASTKVTETRLRRTDLKNDGGVRWMTDDQNILSTLVHEQSDTEPEPEPEPAKQKLERNIWFNFFWKKI